MKKKEIYSSIRKIESLIENEFVWRDDPTPDGIIKVYEIISGILKDSRITFMENLFNEIENANFTTDLNWDGTRGFIEEFREVSLKDRLLYYDVIINARSGCDEGDNITPSFYWVIEQTICVGNIVLFDNDLEEIFLSDLEKENLREIITNLITIK